MLPISSDIRKLLYIAVGVIAGFGVFYAAWSGLVQYGPYRFGDTRFFYAAGRCLNDGLLPYSLQHLRTCWLENFGPEQFAPFVFPPVSWPFAAFIALFPWDIGRWVFAGINLCAMSILIATADRVVNALGPRLTSSLWVAFVALAGSMSVNVGNGQGALLAALGLMLATAGLVTTSSFLLVAGTLLATIKPHVAVLPIAVLILIRPREMIGAKLVATAVVLISAVLPFLVFGTQAIGQTFEAVEAHLKSSVSMFADMSEMYGLLPLFVDMGFDKSACAFLFAAAGISSTLWAGRVLGREHLPELLIFASAMGLLVVPFKTYDLVVVMAAIALAGSTALPALFIPSLVLLWRPETLSKIVAAFPGLHIRPHIYVLAGLMSAILAVLFTMYRLAISRTERTSSQLPSAFMKALYTPVTNKTIM